MLDISAPRPLTVTSSFRHGGSANAYSSKIGNPVKEDIGLLYIAKNLTKGLNVRLGNPSKN